MILGNKCWAVQGFQVDQYRYLVTLKQITGNRPHKKTAPFNLYMHQMMTPCSSRLWRSIALDIKEVRLDITLACGQSFRWKETSPGEWTSVLRGRVWTLKQDNERLFYKVLEPHASDRSVPAKNHQDVKDNDASEAMLDTSDLEVTVGKADALAHTSSGLFYENVLRDYFQLNYSLVQLYRKWSDADSHFRQVASTFTGVRMLRQDPVENLFAFICSSNNHISRISSMVERMCEEYGEPLTVILEEQATQIHYAFPTVDRLAAGGVEQRLRQLGFGYRAKYIHQTACLVQERGGEAWLQSLRHQPYDEVKAELCKLCGVGAKVADCVCLMSMDKLGAIPVDTHVWQFTTQHYMPHLKVAKSLTPTIYNQIGEHFRMLWGDLAGWAHSVLFSADLKKFQDLKSNREVAQKKKRKRIKQSVEDESAEKVTVSNESEMCTEEKKKMRKKQTIVREPQSLGIKDTNTKRYPALK